MDRTARRYVVYRLLDVDGVPVYIGRSCDVVARIRSHQHAAWMPNVCSVAMDGLLTWEEAVREERRQIALFQPVGNVALTARDHRPAVALATTQVPRAAGPPIPRTPAARPS